MSTLSDTWTDREVDHAWAQEVRAWETEHMDDDDVLKMRAETSMRRVYAWPKSRAWRATRIDHFEPYGPDYGYDFDDCDQEEER